MSYTFASCTLHALPLVLCTQLMMQALSMVVLSYSASNAVAFVPSGMTPTIISSSGCSGVRSSSRYLAKGLVPGWIQRPEEGSRSRKYRSRRLFSKSDQAEPTATLTSKRDKRSTVPVKKEPRVSQRTEQDEFFGKVKERDGLRVRTGKKDDMMPVARLCVDTFRGPFEWWMLPLKLFQEVAFCGQVSQRCGSILRNEIQHSIIVIEDTRTHDIVGFLEVGMLPRPTFSEQAAIRATETRREPSEVGEMECATSVGDEVGDDNSSSGVGTTALEKAPDVAYLANVVVDRNQRRRGIGRLMINSAMEMVKELWPSEKRIYVTVEKGNEVAIAVYEALGFEITGLEDEMLARSRKRPSRIYFSKSLI